MRRLFLLLLGLWLAAAPRAPALAATRPTDPQTVALEAVALPVVVNGQLLNYVFCSIVLRLAPKADGTKVRDKEQYVRDDLVRAGHRTPFTRMDDYTRVDEAKVRAEVMRYAAATFGPGVVQSATITRQTSQKLMTLPPPPKARTHEIIP